MRCEDRSDVHGPVLREATQADKSARQTEARDARLLGRVPLRMVVLDESSAFGLTLSSTRLD